MYGTQSIFICFIGRISSVSLCTDLMPILSEGGKGDTTCLKEDIHKLSAANLHRTIMQNKVNNNTFHIIQMLWKQIPLDHWLNSIKPSPSNNSPIPSRNDYSTPNSPFPNNPANHESISFTLHHIWFLKLSEVQCAQLCNQVSIFWHCFWDWVSGLFVF